MKTQHPALELPMICEGCGGEMVEIGNEDDSAIICPSCDVWTPRAVERMWKEKYGTEEVQ